MDLLAVQGTLKSLFQHHSSKASILQGSAFFIVQLSHISQISRVIIYSLDVLLSLFGTSLLFHVQVCCFSTCIQISQEAGQVVWYSHLFKNFPQLVVIHTVKVFGIVNKAEVDVFLELFRFFKKLYLCLNE